MRATVSEIAHDIGLPRTTVYRILETLREAGFEVVTGASDYVTVGMDRGLNWEKLAQATLNIRAGAGFI